MNENERWQKENLRINVKKILPQTISCEPDNHSVTPHTFQATKVYLMTDSEGRELAVVICPMHNLPIPVEVVRRHLHGKGDLIDV